jgi:hypothetical protein
LMRRALRTAGEDARSVERVRWEYEARRCPRFGPAAGVKQRSVQTASVRCRHRGFGFPTVVDDPRHDRLRVGPRSDDRGPLDDTAAGGMRSGKPSDQRSDRVVVHLASVVLRERNAAGGGMAPSGDPLPASPVASEAPW